MTKRNSMNRIYIEYPHIMSLIHGLTSQQTV